VRGERSWVGGIYREDERKGRRNLSCFIENKKFLDERRNGPSQKERKDRAAEGEAQILLQQVERRLS